MEQLDHFEYNFHAGQEGYPSVVPRTEPYSNGNQEAAADHSHQPHHPKRR